MDGEVFGIADGLAARDIPLIFYSGHRHVAALAANYPGAIALSKPCTDDQLLVNVSDQLIRQVVAA